MKHWVLFAVVALVLNAYAQTEDLDATNKGFSNMTQAGKLFQVQLQPADKHLHLFITGLKAGEIQLEDAKIEASIGVGESKKTFVAEKAKDPKTGRSFYKFKNLKHTEPLNLKIRSGDSSEDFTFPPPN